MKFRYCFIFLLFFAALSLKAQNDTKAQEDTTKYEKLVKDTVSFKYNYNRGDTLYYRCSFRDSIVIDFGTPLLKDGSELYKQYCDSIGRKNGHFYISQVLLAIDSKESSGSDSIVRKESDWIGRVVQIEIDSLGNRYSMAVDDTALSALSPGGAFQPFILLPIGKNRIEVGSSWYIGNAYEYPENGVPWSKMNLSYLYVFDKVHDSVDHKFYSIEYSKTGQGSSWVLTPNNKLRNTCVINAAGNIEFDYDLGYPASIFETIERRLTIYKDKEEIKGVHFSNVQYNLVDIRKAIRTVKSNNHKKNKKRR